MTEPGDLGTVDLYGASTACTYLIRLGVLSEGAAGELRALNESIKGELDSRPSRHREAM
jgi:hypothetical protein